MIKSFDSKLPLLFVKWFEMFQGFLGETRPTHAQDGFFFSWRSSFSFRCLIR